MVLELLSNKQLFKSDFQQSTHRLLRLCQLFGTVPWSVRLYETSKERALHRWKQRLIRVANVLQSFGLMVAVTGATVLQHIEFDCKSEFETSEFDCNKTPFMTRMLYICEYIMANTVVAMVLVGCHCQRRWYGRFAEQLLTIAIEIAGCGGAVDFVRIESFFNRLLGCIALYFAGVLLIDFFYNEQQLWAFCRSSAVYTLSNVVNVLGLIQYFYLMYFIFLFYHDMNRLLKGFALQSLRSVERRPYRLSGCRDVVTPSGTTLFDYATVLETLRKTHLKQYKLIEQVIECFGILIVLTTVASFIVLSLQFFAIYRATTTRHWTSTDTYLLVYTVLWIVLHGAKILMILYPAHLVQRERDRTGPILYLFNHNEKDILLNGVLAKFSTQLLHERGHQTACGLMNLEMTLISTMVGALTTYLVILIQFDTAVTQGQSAPNNGSNEKPASGH
ncbi:putative gustatory receptor 59e [Anopheles aquasalis]|uniref:putative gustatory receptor 59e n=1 Tax=Anopheles aquasalis TaxID=42839 RepID=UPI00215B0461|nr:putative gustatory receptor 59e [Anopheles aquasalis]